MSLFLSVPYKIIASKRRKRSIGFKITSTGLEVRVPLKYNESMILPHLEKRRKWIETNWERIQNKKERLTLEDGLKSENPFILYFWENFPIQIFQSEAKEICVFDGEVLRVYLKNTAPIKREKFHTLVTLWYKKEALNYLVQRTLELSQIHNFSQLKNIYIKSYRAKYGMCKWKDVYLDYKLITFPKEIIDHIILHELTHLIYKHHQKSFRQKLSTLDASWKEHRSYLRGKMD